MSSSSSGDAPLAQRFGNAAAGKSKQLLSDSSSGSLPDWIKKHASPYKDVTSLVSSEDSDAEGQAQEERQTQPPAEQQRKNGKGKATQRPAAEPAGPSKSNGVAAAAAAAAAGPSSSMAAVDAGQSQTQPPASQSQQPPNSQQAGPSTGPKAAKEGAGTAAALAQVAANELAVVFPDKLVRSKVLVELEPTDGGATDLAGDAGAVGRLLVCPPAQEGDAPDLRVDLKGVVYQAAVVPLAGTLCVVSTGATEAKVEGLFTDFLQLRPDYSHAAARQAEGNLDSWLLADDDDNYAGEPGPGGETPTPAKRGKKSAKEAAGGGAAKRKPAAKKVGAKGGVAKRKASAKKPGSKVGAKRK